MIFLLNLQDTNIKEIYYMKKQMITAIFLFLIFINICGCTSKEISTQADEITMSTWEYNGLYNTYARISFSENSADITISSNDDYCRIQGICVFGDNCFTVSDNTLKRLFVFGYTFNGNTLSLNYNGSDITLKKAE